VRFSVNDYARTAYYLGNRTLAKYMLLYCRSDQFIQLSSSDASGIIPMVVRSQESTEVDRDIMMADYWVAGIN
jgi:hypothetical protein